MQATPDSLTRDYPNTHPIVKRHEPGIQADHASGKPERFDAAVAALSLPSTNDETEVIGAPHFFGVPRAGRASTDAYPVDIDRPRGREH